MKINIVIPPASVPLITLAAKELRRYLFILGEDLPQITHTASKKGNNFILMSQTTPFPMESICDLDYSGLKPDGFMLKLSSQYPNTFCFTGLKDISVLYAVYHYLELLGIRFHLHGDILPDFRTHKQLWLNSLETVQNPLFSIRGILPFHDFPEGPDWWNKEHYFSVLTQLTKLKANFIGFHSYPENLTSNSGHTGEPLVWIGCPEDFLPDGSIKTSYPAQHYKTTESSFGYPAAKTSEYVCGTGNIFESDCYCADYMMEYQDQFYSQDVHAENLSPFLYNDLFNTYGKFLGDVFAYANKLSIKSCIGSEVPLKVPSLVKKQLKIKNTPSKKDIFKLYCGIFERIANTHPLDYYWLWTPESWTWNGNTDKELSDTLQDFQCALEAHMQTASTFQLALCGWTLGPIQDRNLFDRYLPATVPFSCINRTVGLDPVEPAFCKLSARDSWAVPWMEDDAAMISPQLWVGRMRRDAYDARKYGCTGLLGIHWRTRIISPNVKSLLNSAWDQSWAVSLPDGIIQEGYQGEHSESELHPEQNGIYHTSRNNLSGYTLTIPTGCWDVELIFQKTNCELNIRINYTTLSSIKLNDKNHRVTLFNILLDQNAPMELEFTPINGIINLSAIIVKGYAESNQFHKKLWIRKINCGGNAFEDYENDLPKYKKNSRFAPVKDFYQDFAFTEFGDSIGLKAAHIFSDIDCHLPRPSRWTNGPGSITINERSWNLIKKEYTFVDAFSSLEPLVIGKGNLARYSFWLHSFQAMKITAKIGCFYADFLKTVKDKQSEKALQDYTDLILLVEELCKHLLLCIETPGDMGVLANIQQRSILPMIKNCKKLLLGWYPELPDPNPELFHLPTKLVIPTVQTLLQKGEDFHLKLIVIGGTKETPIFSYRILGDTIYKNIPFQKRKRWVYHITLPCSSIMDDFEYHITLKDKTTTLYYPENELHPDQSVLFF